MQLSISIVSDSENKPSLSAALGSDPSCSNDCTAKRHRFDHGNKFDYYNLARVLIELILLELNTLCNCLDYNVNTDVLCTNDHIQRWYCNIVNLLLQASNATIPCTVTKHFKFLWDDSLYTFKDNCTVSHEN